VKANKIITPKKKKKTQGKFAYRRIVVRSERETFEAMRKQEMAQLHHNFQLPKIQRWSTFFQFHCL
jgi:hypothetical protein